MTPDPKLTSPPRSGRGPVVKDAPPADDGRQGEADGASDPRFIALREHALRIVVQTFPIGGTQHEPAIRLAFQLGWDAVLYAEYRK